jgi:hypothetical protein
VGQAREELVGPSIYGSRPLEINRTSPSADSWAFTAVNRRCSEAVQSTGPKAGTMASNASRIKQTCSYEYTARMMDPVMIEAFLKINGARDSQLRTDLYP